MAWYDGFLESEWGLGDLGAFDEYDPAYYDAASFVEPYMANYAAFDPGQIYSPDDYYDPASFVTYQMETPMSPPPAAGLGDVQYAPETQPAAFQPPALPGAAGGETEPFFPETALPYHAGGMDAPAAGTPGPLSRAASGIGDFFGNLTPGKAAQGIMGLGSIAAIGAGLASGASRSSKVKLSPQEKAAADALALARARASGTLASRGYAGEEGIRELLNQQVSGYLSGDLSGLTPEMQRRMDEDMRAFKDRLKIELGPQAQGSTAWENAINNHKRMWEEAVAGEGERRLIGRSNMALGRSQFTRQLEMDPATLAQMELGSLSGIAESQANRASADRRALLSLGGQLGGVALSPYLYQAMLENYRRPSTARVAA